MKKKFINGFLMVAMLFATTSSFVSCKDNIDDDLSPVYANLGKKSAELQDKINNLQSQIDAIEPEIINYITNYGDTIINNITQKIDTQIIKRYDVKLDSVNQVLQVINNQITNQSLTIDSITNALSVIDNRIIGISDSVKTLWERVDEIEKKIEDLFDGTFITNVEIETTRNDVLGIINAPGLQSYGLAAYYGTNDAGIEQFPYAGYDFNVGGDRFACYLEDYELPDDGYVSFDESDYITGGYGNAGQIYFTINTNDYEAFDLSKFAKIQIENSVGEAAPVELNFRKSSALINWDFGHAYLIETGKDVANGLYVADATIKEEDLDPSRFEIEKFINFEKLKKEIKARLDDIRQEEKGTQYKGTFKNLIRELSGLAFGLIKNDLTENDLMANVTYSPQRLAFFKMKDGKLKRIGQTGMKLYVTSVKPLSYNTFWEYENSKTGNWVIEEALERSVSRLAKEIRERWGSYGITVELIEFNDADRTLSAKINGNIEKLKCTSEGQYNNLKRSVAKNGGISGLNKLLAKYLKNYTLGGVTQKAAEQINLYLDKCSDYLTDLINDHLFTRAVAPIIIFETSTGMDRLCEGMFFNRGIMHAYLTSGTMELLVPAYKKYVALEKDGMLLQSAVLPGSTQSYDFDLNEKGDYKIIISCVDYFGYVVTKKYDIYVK